MPLRERHPRRTTCSVSISRRPPRWRRAASPQYMDGFPCTGKQMASKLAGPVAEARSKDPSACLAVISGSDEAEDSRKQFSLAPATTWVSPVPLSAPSSHESPQSVEMRPLQFCNNVRYPRNQSVHFGGLRMLRRKLYEELVSWRRSQAPPMPQGQSWGMSHRLEGRECVSLPLRRSAHGCRQRQPRLGLFAVRVAQRPLLCRKSVNVS